MQFYLTDAGRACLARVNAGEMELHFTKAVAGAGNAVHPELQPEVLEPMQQLQIDEVSAEGEYTQIVCVLTNLEWEQEYILRQIGLYARDISGAETLIIIGQDPYGDRIPPITEKEVEYQYHIGMKVDNAQNISFDFSVDDFLRKKYFYEHLAEFAEYKAQLAEQLGNLPTVRIGPESMLNRNNVILLRETPGNRIDRILERDAAGQKQEYHLASAFLTPDTRAALIPGSSIDDLIGMINRHLKDLKNSVYKDADDPFVLMTETTYKPPSARQKGTLYGLITKERNLIILMFSRYVQGLEDPRNEMTLYGVETSVRTENIKSDRQAKAILDNFIELPEAGGEMERTKYMIYGRVSTQKGVS